MRAGTDLAPPRMAALVAAFLDALDLRDVVLVGNDSGGAVSQIVAAHHADRLGGLVLTNCDTFEHFPPGAFKALAQAAKVPAAFKAALAPMGSAAARRSPLGYGMLTHGDIDDLAREWVEPVLTDDAVREDVPTFTVGMRKAITIEAAERLKASELPILLAWGADDRLFSLKHAERFVAEIPRAQLHVIAGARTLPMLDRPEELAEIIGTLAPAPAVT
jgi:pimeloyl-ACP methyl ester carboxylesterase